MNSISEKPRNGKRPSKGIASTFRSSFFLLLTIVYIIGILVSGYWYWMRPVRSSQFKYAVTWWDSMAAIYHLPVPSTQTWDSNEVEE